MQNPKWHYYQFRKTHDYPVYLRIREDEMNQKFTHLFNELGFNLLSDQESKRIALQKANTRMLTVQLASTRLSQQMMIGSDLDKYGSEVLSLQMGTPVYTYKKVGIMAIPTSKALWDLALHAEISQTDQMIGLRIVLVRFLAQALADHGVLSYWGASQNGAVTIMKQNLSFGEAVFIDWNKKVIFSNGGEVKMGPHQKLIRKDKDFKTASPMGREEIISFLSVSTCLLSFNGITNAMKRAILEMSAQSSCTHAVSEVSSLHEPRMD